MPRGYAYGRLSESCFLDVEVGMVEIAKGRERRGEGGVRQGVGFRVMLVLVWRRCQGSRQRVVTVSVSPIRSRA